MSSDSSSSRESSPTRFHPGTPGSDADGIPQSSWQPSAPAFHPSASYQASQLSNAPVLRQPVGFGTSPPSVPTYHAPPPETSTSAQQYLPGQNPPSEEPASKSRKKSTKSKETSKSSSRKGKEIEKTPSSSHTVAAQSYPSPAAPPIQKTAFRVRSYSNDPTAVGSPYTIQDGPYGAAYRAELPDRPKPTKISKKKSRSTVTETQAAPPPAQAQSHPPPPQGHPTAPHHYPSHAMQQPPHPQSHPQHPPYQYPPQPQPGQDMQPRSSYYRYDYEKIRQSAPTRQAQAQAQAPPQSSAPPSYPPQHHYTHPAPPPPHGEHHSSSSRSSKRKDTHAYPHEYQYPPPTDYHYREPSPPPPPPGDYYGSPPPQPPPAYPPSYPASYPASYTPTPSHSPEKEKRHKSKSRSHRQDHALPAPPPQGYPPAPHIPDAPPPAIRVCRILTLLIEDKRDPSGESLLAEVRVPLKPAEPGDEGFWADAQEVSEELQKGPSRIDGAAKVYTLRGKYKQYFLRISADGEPICQPANLKVTPDRTVEIYIEDNLPPGGKAIDTRSSPPRLQRELLTPMTDSMASPSPAPGPSPPKRSSLFSVDLTSPTEDKFDNSAYMASAALEARRKRPRSSSMQSVQSVQSAFSDDYTMQTQRDGSPSPSSPPEETSSGPQSRTHSETPPAPQSQDSASTQPMSRPRDIPAPAIQQTQARTDPSSQPPEPSAPSPATATSAFPTVQSASTPARSLSSSFLPGPSPPKKAKLLVPQSDTRTEKSVSPGPSQAVAYPWSNSRTPSFSDSSAPSISKGTKTGLSASSSSSNPFAQYQSSFSLSGRSMDMASRSVSTPGSGISIPSLSTVSIAPTATMTPPTTLAPSATSLAPSLSGAATSALDNTVGMWIKGIISKEPQWDTFVKNRSRVLKMSEQLKQYEYVQRVIDRYEGTTTPADLEGAGGVKISKAQVMRAFNLPLSWGEECTETLVMTTLYGPGGTRCEDARVCAMLEETPPITTGMQAKKYLTLLREVHGQWTIAHPDG